MLFAVPPADELRRLVYQHGGRYQQYYSKRSVTHIIATNLPNSKIQELMWLVIFTMQLTLSCQGIMPTSVHCTQKSIIYKK